MVYWMPAYLESIGLYYSIHCHLLKSFNSVPAGGCQRLTVLIYIITISFIPQL